MGDGMRLGYAFLVFITLMGLQGCGKGNASEQQLAADYPYANPDQCLAPAGGIAKTKFQIWPFEWKASVLFENLQDFSTTSQNITGCEDKAGADFTACMRQNNNACFANTTDPGCQKMACSNGDCSSYTQICFYKSTSNNYWKDIAIETPRIGMCCGPFADSSSCLFYPTSNPRQSVPLVFNGVNDQLCTDKDSNQNKLKCTPLLTKTDLALGADDDGVLLLSRSNSIFLGLASDSPRKVKLCWNQMKGKRVVFRFED